MEWLFHFSKPALFAFGLGSDSKFDTSQPMQALQGTGSPAREPHLWNALTDPVHSVAFKDGGHWDYLADFTCDNDIVTPGTAMCQSQWLLTGDILTTFFSHYMQPVTGIALSMIPPVSADVAKVAGGVAFYQKELLSGYMHGREAFLSKPCAAFFNWRTLEKFGTAWLFNAKLTTPPWLPEPSGN